MFQLHRTGVWPPCRRPTTSTPKPAAPQRWVWVGAVLHSVLGKPSAIPSATGPWVRPTPPPYATSKRECRCLNKDLTSIAVHLQDSHVRHVFSLFSSEQTVTVTGLRPNTRYEFSVRLHMDQMSSPWSASVYQRTLLEGSGQNQHWTIWWYILRFLKQSTNEIKNRLLLCSQI